MEEFFSAAIKLITDFGLKIIAAVIILFIGFKLSKWISKLIPNARVLKNLDIGIRKFFSNAVRISLYVLTFVTAAGTVGIPYASFVAVLGSAGIAIGLALQGSLSNIAAGILILFNKPFKIGDFIEADGVQGTVKEIGFFTTVITTLDNKVIHYPNSAISNKCITNYSANDMRRVDINFSVSYDTDIDLAKSVLLSVASDHPLTSTAPAPPFARFTRHDDSALILTLRVWCETKNYWAVYYDMIEDVKKAFDKNGIGIPYPQLDVHMKQQ